MAHTSQGHDAARGEIRFCSDKKVSSIWMFIVDDRPSFSILCSLVRHDLQRLVGTRESNKSSEVITCSSRRLRIKSEALLRQKDGSVFRKQRIHTCFLAASWSMIEMYYANIQKH